MNDSEVVAGRVTFMKKETRAALSVEQNSQSSLSLGDYGYAIISEQFKRITKQEKSVLKDADPEHLHQMRVGTRRLRTALQVFDAAVELPSAARSKRLRNLARALGAVRDLDVQISSLQEHYQPQLSQSESSKLEKAIAALQTRRTKDFTKMTKALNSQSYKKLKTAYADWLEEPQYQAIATLSVATLLPDLLTPLLAHLLLHPGWLISAEEAAGKNGVVLHDLRKLCKHVRYEAEFFTSFYDEAFQAWIKEIKVLQDRLGEFQDTQVLLDLLADKVEDIDEMPELQQAILRQQAAALSDWDSLRQNYLDASFRYGLHDMLLQPLASERSGETVNFN